MLIRVNSEANVLVPDASNNLVIAWVTMQFFSMDQLSDGSHERNEIWHKGSLGVRMMPNFAYTHSAEKVLSTTLDNEKYDVHCSDGIPDQPEAFALDLSDD